MGKPDGYQILYICSMIPSYSRNTMNREINFCQRCGSELVETTVSVHGRPSCPRCGYVVYLDPKLAAVSLVSVDSKLVLVRRAIEPKMGFWSYPGGYVDRGETVEDAAIREVKEETNLDIELTGFIGLYSSSDRPVVVAVYSAIVVGGDLSAGEEVQEAGLFDPSNVPDMPFHHDYEILADWSSKQR